MRHVCLFSTRCSKIRYLSKDRECSSQIIWIRKKNAKKKQRVKIEYHTIETLYSVKIQTKLNIKIKHLSRLFYKMCSKSIKTKAVFTKTEMNNEWNIHFLQNMSHFLKGINTKVLFPNTEMNSEHIISIYQSNSLSIKPILFEWIFHGWSISEAFWIEFSV